MHAGHDTEVIPATDTCFLLPFQLLADQAVWQNVSNFSFLISFKAAFKICDHSLGLYADQCVASSLRYHKAESFNNTSTYKEIDLLLHTRERLLTVNKRRSPGRQLAKGDSFGDHRAVKVFLTRELLLLKSMHIRCMSYMSYVTITYVMSQIDGSGLCRHLWQGGRKVNARKATPECARPGPGCPAHTNHR